MAKKKAQPGQIVIHRSLDDQKIGSAKTGIAKETVGDEEQELIIAEFSDSDEPLAYDSRELIIVDPNSLNKGPMIIRPRHFLAVIKQPWVLIAFLIALVFIVALNIGVHAWGWSLQGSVIFAGLFLLVGIVVFRKTIERSFNDKRD